MYVLKRDHGTGMEKREPVSFDRITERIVGLAEGLSEHVDAVEVAQKVIQGLYSGITTTELDALSAETSAALTTKHPDYGFLAARIAVSNLQKNTPASFSECVEQLYTYVDDRTGRKAPLVSDEFYQ